MLMKTRLNLWKTGTRAYSLAALDATKLRIEKTNAPSKRIPNEKLVFGTQFTDHMLEIEWTVRQGWHTPRITPYHNLELHPLASVFHYGFELFEGLKAYRDSDNNIRTFRMDKNMARMNATSERIAMPKFDGEQLMKLIDKLLLLDKDLAPIGVGHSLYIRPVMIATSPGLGVGVPDRVFLYVIVSPVGPYFSKDSRPISLEATTQAVRAWPGGTGNRKVGGNYAPCIKPQLEAAARGYDQNMWLFGEEDYVTEVGMMNVFFVFQGSDGKKELVTPPLDGTILEGVTRDSILELARERLDSNEWRVSERKFTMKEVEDAVEKDTLVEAFGAGTAAIVAPIAKIGYRGREIAVPLAASNSGEVAKNMKQWILEIQHGETEFRDWSRVAK